MKTKRQDKRTRALNKRITTNARNTFISMSSIYNPLHISYYGGMSKSSKYFHIKNNIENKMINRLDKLLKVC
tara:strand:- start:678 stop:893 length:216 start_codon:yes stop_codon:yes gene_type:complete